MKKSILFLVAAAVVIFVGCTTTGVRVKVDSSDQSLIGDVNWEEYKIPVLSLYNGPRILVWVNKDYLVPSVVRGYGVVTNDVHAFGFYSNNSTKTAGMEIQFDVVSSNGVPVCVPVTR